MLKISVSLYLGSLALSTFTCIVPNCKAVKWKLLECWSDLLSTAIKGPETLQEVAEGSESKTVPLLRLTLFLFSLHGNLAFHGNS